MTDVIYCAMLASTLKGNVCTNKVTNSHLTHAKRGDNGDTDDDMHDASPKSTDRLSDGMYLCISLIQVDDQRQFTENDLPRGNTSLLDRAVKISAEMNSSSG